MSQYHLVQIEQQALNLKNKGDLKPAIELFNKIIDENPNYEYGICFYNLALCYEELKEYEKARECYIKAVEYDNEDEMRLCGLASFLYLHGNIEEAFFAYLNLLRVEKRIGFDIKKTLSKLTQIGRMLGYDEQKINEMMDKI